MYCKCLAVYLENKGGKTEAQWVYRYKHDPEEPLTEKPKFMFKAKALHAKDVESGTLEISSDILITVIDSTNRTVGDIPLEITFGDSLEKVKTDKKGIYEKKDIPPGLAQVSVIIEESYNRPEVEEYTCKEDEKIIPVSAAIGKHTVLIETGEKAVIQLSHNSQGLST